MLALSFLLQGLAGDPGRSTCHDKQFNLKLQRYRQKQSRRRRRPRAQGSRREQTVRRILRGLAPGHNWNSMRPDWLTNPYTGRRMEIDCFAPALGACGVAVEVQGQHHYSSKYIGQDEYQKQCKRDHIKAELIRARGIPLILVPSPDTVEDADIEAYLCVQLASLDLNKVKQINHLK